MDSLIDERKNKRTGSRSQGLKQTKIVSLEYHKLQ